MRKTSLELWPTQVSFFETPLDWAVNRQLADEAIAAVGTSDAHGVPSASKRRVRGILERSAAGQALKTHLFACARDMLGPWSSYLDPDHCENRALVIAPGGFISTHKDSREGDLTCVHFLTGSGSGQPVNSIGTPRFVIEDPSRYFDEGRLPYEARHGYSVNPRPGMSVFFPAHIPHNQHPYQGSTPHVQVVANFRVTLPDALEERLFD
ncbi:hypothetical protein OIU14_14235 [Thalassobacter stenotrophicus]|uniref:hypothetical protein n=1 Tax=Thalassobacter stenotrophicus TaxID=266809 RepID=UPI0022A915C4|nr:hypothetical protein [Thalassobacter stenotrophicus]UYP67624.1 hypothetical protein OIU14_14235 [Thalassobacter stenotrophicus]